MPGNQNSTYGKRQPMSERGSKKRNPPAQANQRVGEAEEIEDDEPEEELVAPPSASFNTMTFDDLEDDEDDGEEEGGDESGDGDESDDGGDDEESDVRRPQRMDAADLANQMLGSDRRGAKRETKHKPSTQYHCRPYKSDGLPSDDDKLIIPGSAAETKAELQQELVRRAPTKLGEWEIVVWEKTVKPNGQFKTIAVKTYDIRTDRIIPDEEEEESSDDHARYAPIRPFIADEDDGRSRRRRRDDDDDDERSSMPQQPSMVAMLMQQQTELIRSMMDRRNEPPQPAARPMDVERVLELAAKATPLVELFKGKDPGDKMFDAFDRGLQSARQMEKTPWGEIMQLMVVGTLMQNPNLPKDMVGGLAKLFGSKLGGEATEAVAAGAARPKIEVLDTAPPVPALPDQQRAAAQQPSRGPLAPVDFRKGTCWAAMNGIFEAAMTDTELASRCQYTDFWAMRMWGEMPRAAIHDILSEKPEILCGELLDSAPNVYRWIASNFPESERNTPETQRHIAQTAVAWVADLQQEIRNLIQRRSTEGQQPAPSQQPDQQESTPQT